MMNHADAETLVAYLRERVDDWAMELPSYGGTRVVLWNNLRTAIEAAPPQRPIGDPDIVYTPATGNSNRALVQLCQRLIDAATAMTKEHRYTPDALQDALDAAAELGIKPTQDPAA